MPKEVDIRAYLKKTMNSQCFTKSVVVKELLKFLVEQSTKDETPTEFEVAYRVFGKTSDINKEKNIRIYVHNLRKKLQEYYQKEGHEDEVIFSIPKGAYKVVFTENKKVITRRRLSQLSPYFLLASILILIVAISVFSSKDRAKVTRSFIWEEIYQSSHPLLVVLGDHYFFMIKDQLGKMGITRYTNINSDKDLDELLENHTGTHVEVQKTEQTYINKQAPFGLYKIMSFLGGGQVDIDMRYSSSLQWEHLKKNNVIFIGSYKTQNILKKIHEKIGLTYDVDDTKLFYQTVDSTMVFDSRNDGFLHIEYASLSRFITKDGRSIISFMCDSDVGNIATLNYISESNNLKKLEQAANQLETNNFKAVFEVRGQQQTEFVIYLRRLDPIAGNIDEIWP